MELQLPMRVTGRLPFYGDRKSFSGTLDSMHASDLDARQNYFLTKAGRLQPCTPADVSIVKRNDGVLYHPELSTSALVMIFQGELDALKDLARNAKDYSVAIKFSELAYERPLSWGYHRRDSYHELNWDCEKLREDVLQDGSNPQPLYFPVAIGKEDQDKIPEILHARIDSLSVRDKGGKVVDDQEPRAAVEPQVRRDNDVFGAGAPE